MTDLDIMSIMNHLPHRYPFLLVDRVVDYELNEKITAYKNVTANESFFQGHFPNRPVMPGVLIMEALAQAGALLAFLSMGPDIAGKLAYIMGMDKVKFRHPVVPGDRLDLIVEKVRLGTRYWKLKGEARVGQTLVAEGILTAAIDVG